MNALNEHFNVIAGVVVAPTEREVFWVCFRSSTFVARTVLKKVKNHSTKLGGILKKFLRIQNRPLSPD
jgi:hypothetical protein